MEDPWVLLGYAFVAAPLVWPLGMMLIAWTSRRAWATLGLGVAGGLAIWFLTMPVMLRGHEYHWAQVTACAVASIVLVLWLGARVSPRGLLPAWATSFGLTLGFLISNVLPDENRAGGVRSGAHGARHLPGAGGAGGPEPGLPGAGNGGCGAASISTVE